MPRLCHFDGIIITMDYMGHNPPHFHANYGEFDITVAIPSFRFKGSGFPTPKKRILLRWAEDNLEKLMECWEYASNGRKPPKISP